MNAAEILHLEELDINSIEPVGYSITFESDERKLYWIVSFTGNKQALLIDSNKKIMKFQKKNDAEEFCKKRWADFPLI